MQEDKNGRGWLTRPEFARFCQHIVPGATAGEIRYLEVMLDHDSDGHVSFHDVHHLADVAKRTGLAFPVKTRLDATDVLKRVAVFMFDKGLTAAAFFRRFDTSGLQRLSKRQLATVLHVVMKSATSAEARQMVNEFVRLFDVDGDGLVSQAEFVRAMELGEPQLPALEDAWGPMDTRTDFGSGASHPLSGRALERLAGEHAVLRRVEAAGSPLTALLQQVSSLTGGRSRTLEMGSAKAAAQHIDATAMQALLTQLQAEVALCKEFEVAYASRLNLERNSSAAGARTTRAKGSGRVQQTEGAAASGPAPRRAGPHINASAEHVLEAAMQAANQRAVAGQGGARQQAGPVRLPAGSPGVVAAPRQDDSVNVVPYSPPREARHIPVISKRSHLLHETEARTNYMHAMIERAGDMAALVNDVSARASGYPAAGPGPIQPSETAWEKRRRRVEEFGGSRQTVALLAHAGQPPAIPLGRPVSAAPRCSSPPPLRQRPHSAHAAAATPPSTSGASALNREAAEPTGGREAPSAFPPASAALQRPLLPVGAHRDAQWRTSPPVLSHGELMMGLENLDL